MSSSNIIVRFRYSTSKNRTKSINNWSDYVSNKKKADGSSLDENELINDYINYSNSESFLWSHNGDVNVKKHLKELNIDSKGILWDMVISFDPDFALNNGLVTKKDFYKLSKNIMPSFLTDLGLNLNNTNWYIGLHRNTKNPHMHILFFEEKVKNHFRTIPKNNIYKIKSYIANYLIDNKSFYELRDKTFKNIINKISFQKLTRIEEKKHFSDKYRRELNHLFLTFYDELKNHKGRLQYNSKIMNKHRDHLDFIIDYILLNDPIRDYYQIYYNVLEQHQKELNNIYGMSDLNKNNKYLNEQLNKLYSKIGNEILQNYKVFNSKSIMEKEISFMKNNINNLNFKSKSDYKKEITIFNIGKDLYTICNMCDLNVNQIKKIFTNWIQASKYDYDVDYLLKICQSDNKDISSTNYYSLLKKLGYSFDRLKKFQNKNFYKELSYKKLINNAFNHIQYEYKKEQKELEKELLIELD